MSVQERIKNEVNANPVLLFLKGTPEAPRCGFSSAVVEVLKHFGVDYKGIDVLQDEEIRQGVKEFANWPTFPQLYVKGEFVGGCDIVREMAEEGELEALFKDKGIPYRAA